MKVRIFPESNYKAIHMNGKTIRIALDPKQPITELKFPEFYDVKVTGKCFGNCPWCYQDSKETCENPENAVQKFGEFFGSMTENEKPFQIAFGGGEPTESPDFLYLLIKCSELGITPNYTTNGMWVDYMHPAKMNTILEYTKKYCGGVAVSTHPHLRGYWLKAVDLYLSRDIFTNLHIIISDKKSVDDFMEIYKKYTGKVKYFVLLPLTAQGRAKEASIDWDYLQSQIQGSPKDIAFGANFYPYLMKDPKRFNVSLYEPEIMSKYLDLSDMKIYPSSFSTTPIN